MQEIKKNLLMQEWKSYIESFFQDFDYPKEARQSLLKDWEYICSDESTFDLFVRYDSQYAEDVHLPYKDILNELTEHASACRVHSYSLHLLFYIVLSRRAKEIYRERGISMDIFHCSMMDFRCKLMECYKVFGIWGTSVAWWQDWWFEIRRFGLGRFQYELVSFPDTYKKDGISLQPGDTVINVHIPSSGPLRREECLQSYAMAADFFRDSFVSRPVVFFCESWMLFPEHPLFLPDTSHILEFMQDYDIYKSEYTNGDLWRIFNREYDGKPELLPADTGLQRAYRTRLMNGHQAGIGFGVFVYNKAQENKL